MAYLSETIVSNGTLTVTVIPPVPGMARWFDASSPDWFATNAAGKVTQWMDLSANAANAINATGTREPIYAANTLNGRGTLQFSSQYGSNTGDYLSFTRFASIRTAFSVFKGESFLLTDSSAYHFHRSSDIDATKPLWDNGYVSPNIKGGTTYVNRVQVNGVTFPMPINLNNGFNLVTVQTTNSVQADSFNKDRTAHSGNQSHAEVLIYDRVLTESERLQTEDYLSQKWFGVGGALQNPMPVGSAVTVLSGATLDLSGCSQEIASLKGSGSVINGTLVVTSSIDLTNGVVQATAINASLTLAPGTELRVDHTTSASDIVVVSGTLKLQGANTVRLNTLGGALPPFQLTLFTFGTLDGIANLSNWTVELPPALANYATRIHAGPDSVYVNVFLSGTMIRVQ